MCCGWKRESQFGVVNFMVYLRSRIELTSLASSKSRCGQQHSSLSTRQSPTRISFRKTELFIPPGLGILANVSTVACEAKPIVQLPSALYWTILHLLSGCYGHRKEWYEESSAASSYNLSLLLPHSIPALNCSRTIWTNVKISHLSKPKLLSCLLFSKLGCILKSVAQRIWHELFLNIHKLFFHF